MEKRIYDEKIAYALLLFAAKSFIIQYKRTPNYLAISLRSIRRTFKIAGF